MATEATDPIEATEHVEGARCFQVMVPMRDGARMNTFVYLPEVRWTALSRGAAPDALRHHVARGRGDHRPHPGLAA